MHHLCFQAPAPARQHLQGLSSLQPDITVLGLFAVSVTFSLLLKSIALSYFCGHLPSPASCSLRTMKLNFTKTPKGVKSFTFNLASTDIDVVIWINI